KKKNHPNRWCFLFFIRPHEKFFATLLEIQFLYSSLLHPQKPKTVTKQYHLPLNKIHLPEDTNEKFYRYIS
ncbi:TPA: hypothetical protein ACGORN_002119, partial [Streptococcus suis]